MIMEKIVMFVDNFKNRYIRNIANGVCMATSCGLTVYGVVQLFSHPVLQSAMGVFIGVIDVWMQYLLAYGKWLRKQKDKKTANQYFFAYASYALIFNFMFAIGFFFMEIDVTDQVFKQNNMGNITYQTQERIEEINGDLKINERYRLVESEHDAGGYGTRSKELTKEKDALINERKELEKFLRDSNEVQQTKVKVSRNIFNSLESVFKPLFGWTAGGLKVAVFSMLIFVMQFGLIATSWDINPTKNSKNGNDLSEDKKEKLKALDGFFDGKNGTGLEKDIPLNGVDVVAKKTGLTKDECVLHRNNFSRLKVNGDTAFRITKGATYSNYPKKVIHDYIISH